MVTQDYTYDQESWALRITLESTYSTSANRAGSDDFTLELRDVCWDLPLTAPVMTATDYTLYLWDADASTGTSISDVITIDTAMTISWSDQEYCGGFSYNITLISTEANSAKAQELDADGVLITDEQIETEINAIWVNTYDTLTLDGYPDSTDWIDTSTGIGTWGV